MKTITTFILFLCAVIAFGQAVKEDDLVIDTRQIDDTYSAAETMTVNAVVKGDLVIAGGKLTVNDSIMGDLTAAGGEFLLNGYVEDDVRIAVGKAIIDSEIGDDLVIFGGEVIITKNAVIHGNIKCFAGDITMNGTVMGKLNLKGTDVFVNGIAKDSSKIITEDLTLGSNAKFYKDVEYWNSDGEIDFNNALVDANSRFKQELEEEQSSSLQSLGMGALKLWIFYVLSAFLVILVIHALFKNAFADAVVGIENKLLKSFGFGLIYLFGIPLIILLAFLLIIGIPLGLFAAGVFVFSLFFGHLIAALLLVYYVKHNKAKNWNFWSITFLALLFAIGLRLLTMIPFVGILISIVILSITYGALTLKVIEAKKQSGKIQTL
ncbi:hypothetical protein ACJD0Z_07125 [Flavobacteriaceae bacterium M23B6Z8]